MQNENELQKSNKNGTSEIQTISPFCRTDCSTCNSNHTEEIHQLVELKKSYIEICAYLKKKYGYETSPASLSRHFKNFKEHKRLIVTQKLNVALQEETDALVEHQTQAVFLAKEIFKQLEKQITSGRLSFTVKDWSEVVKIYHSILKGDGDSNLNDMVLMMQTASDKYGFNVNQGVLLKLNGNEALA